MILQSVFKFGTRFAAASCLGLIALHFPAPLAAQPEAAPESVPGVRPAGPEDLMMGPTPEIKFVAPRPQDTVIAEIDGKPFTVGELQDWARYSNLSKLTGDVPPEKYPELPDDALAQLTRTIAARLSAARDVQSLPVEQQAEYLSQFEPFAEQTVLGYLGTTRIVDKISTPSEEVLTDYYEKHKELYHQPFQFWMRHLVLLTYDKYSVREGDTLESIAGRIAGDEKLADEIRADLPSRPPRRGDATDFKPLDPGEALLVPMSPPEAEKVRLHLEELLAKLKAGTTFEELAREYSESDAKGEIIGPLPTGTKPMLEELIEVGRKTAVGEVSPIFRTKHGYQVIQIEKKQEEGTRSYESVRPIIINKMLAEQRQKAQEELLDGLYNDPRRIVYYDQFANRDALTTATVMAEIQGAPVKILFKDIRDDWERRGQPHTQPTVDAYMKSNRTLMVGLARLEGDKIMQDPESELSRRMKFAGSDVMGAIRLDKLAREQAAQRVSNDEVSKFYQENLDVHFKKPQYVAYAVLAHKLSEQDAQQAADPEKQKALMDQLLKSMQTEVGKFTTEQDFLNRQAQAAQEAGLKPINEKNVKLDALPQEIQEALQKIEPGQWTEPFILGDTATSLLLQARTEAGYIPEADVTSAIRGKLAEPFLPEIGNKLRDDYAAKVGYKSTL